MDIGKRIRKKRLELNLSQDELATKLGYKDRSTIAKIESGVNDITQTNIVRFAKALDCTPAYLMGWEDMEKTNDVLTDIVIKAQSNDKLFNILEKINSLDEKDIDALSIMFNSFFK